jgi:hypothetical protein
MIVKYISVATGKVYIYYINTHIVHSLRRLYLKQTYM